eukprot:scaffold14832_cov129-Isochrysis_galbana.AAC.4
MQRPFSVHLGGGHAATERSQEPDVVFFLLAILDEHHVQRVLDLVWYDVVEVLVRLVPAGEAWHPAQRQCNLPHMGIHRKISTLQAKQENARDGLSAHTLETDELVLYFGTWELSPEVAPWGGEHRQGVLGAAPACHSALRGR